MATQLRSVYHINILEAKLAVFLETSHSVCDEVYLGKLHHAYVKCD